MSSRKNSLFSRTTQFSWNEIVYISIKNRLLVSNDVKFELIILNDNKVYLELIAYIPIEYHAEQSPGLEVIKLDYSLKLKIKRNDWLLADTCTRAAYHCTLF